MRGILKLQLISRNFCTKKFEIEKKYLVKPIYVHTDTIKVLTHSVEIEDIYSALILFWQIFRESM